MKRIKKTSYFIAGILAIVLLFGGAALALTGTQSANITFRSIRLVIDGREITPEDANGNIVEPFIYNGTTYLPVRAVGEAFGKDVDWNGDTSTVYIGGVTARPAKEVLLYTKPYIAIGDSGGFSASGNETENRITVNSTEGVDAGNEKIRYSNYVVYALNAAAVKFTATLNPPLNESNELIYRIYGDGKQLYTSPIITPNVLPVQMNLDVTGVIEMKIEVTLTTVNTLGRDYKGFADWDYRGIENAVIVTTDY